MSHKTFTVLENNPTVLNHLAYTLGLSPTLSFHDVYSLTDPDLLSLIPRPVHALLAIIPLTNTWRESRLAEDKTQDCYDKAGANEPVVWFKQTIPHACGTIGLLHCLCNGAAVDAVTPESTLDQLLKAAIPLPTAERAKTLENSKELYEAHEAAAEKSDSRTPQLRHGERMGQHFVAFVKGRDGHLWELEGTRKGPIDRGVLEEGEDALSARAVALGLGRLIDRERESGGDLRFSVVALAR